jgi:hypothetical protein
MKAPIIVNEHGNVMFFESVEAAERYLEPIDVENDEYVAYDGEGRLLRLVATSPRITIEDAEAAPAHAHVLRHLLLQFFPAIGIPQHQLETDSLHELVARGVEYKTE